MTVDLRKKPKKYLLAAGLLLSVIAYSCAHAVVNVRMQTDLGAVDIDLFDTQAVLTVGNFLNYVTDGDYNGTFLHRSLPGFILQGGGFIFNPDNGSLLISEGNGSGSGGSQIPTDPPVVNEPDPVNRSNVRGTIAMAKAGGDPDSATSQFFFNLADNSANLDNQNGGFTVFGQVTGNGMDVIDAIADMNQERCRDLLSNLTSCGPGSFSQLYSDLPLVAMSSSNGVILTDDVSSNPVLQQYNLFNILHIGSDTDGDGIADSLEDEGANAGDADNDTIPDRDQQDIATYRAISGSLVTLEATAGVVLESTSFMGRTFGFTTYDVLNPPAVIDGFDFVHGHLGFTLNNITDPFGKAAVSVSFSIPDTTCRTISDYFQYGPTPADNTPHWYEFNYDAVTDTGAEINGNVITLHYVDGERGDSALGVAGIIETLGGTAQLRLDNDGVPEFVEDAAQNAGDGNNDGICDSVQDNVSSLPGARNDYMTIEAPPGFLLSSIGSIPAGVILTGQDLSAIPAGVNLAFDFLTFEIGGLANNGDSVEVKLVLPKGNNPVSYFMFGPTPGNNVAHLYEFLFDAATGTGAKFNGNEVTLNFVDGERGDFDLTANGVIIDPGTPALFAATIAPSGGGGGGGCSLSNGTDRPAQAGAWYLLLFLTVLYGIWRHNRQVRLGTGIRL